jgi:hypothetical protein
VTLVDTTVLLDVVTDNPDWAAWSQRQLGIAALKGPLAIIDVAYTEISVRFRTIEEVGVGDRC